MIDQETLRKLREMKLDGLAAGFEELLTRATPHDMTPIDIIGRPSSRAPSALLRRPLRPQGAPRTASVAKIPA